MADISTGADAVVDERLDYIKFNKVKNHYRAAAAPADAVAGVIWQDSDDNQVYIYNGAAWIPLLTATGLSALTGTMKWDKGADIASQAALAPGADGNYFDVTGVSAITSIAAVQSQPGTVIYLHFDGILVLTHHATDLILPGGANITTAAGDEAIFIEYAAGDWRCVSYTKASGRSVISSIPEGSIIAWAGGYFTNGANAGYTHVLGAANSGDAVNALLNPRGWYVCNGGLLNLAASTIFNGAGRYLPNLSDSRFLMGSTAGDIGGNNSSAHTHGAGSYAGENHDHDAGTYGGDSHTHITTVAMKSDTLWIAKGPYGTSTINQAYWLGPACNDTAAASADYHKTSGSTVTISGRSGAAGISITGTSDAASATENRPLYLSCFFIMRVLP